MTSETEDQLLEIARTNDSEALGKLMQGHYDRLRRIIDFRMDVRIRDRLDADDVLQESFLEATRRFDYYLENRKTNFFLWLRYLTLQKLKEIHRNHLGVKARDARRDRSIFASPNSESTSVQIASALFDDHTTPTEALIRDEARGVIEKALSEMDPVDQEVLALRHFEQLSNREVADVLGLESSAASKRFVRAIERLRDIVDHYGNPSE